MRAHRSIFFFFTSVSALGILSLSSQAAYATERRFTFTYESGVLNPGEAEIEPWTTARFGRDHFYNRLDERLEFEFGLVPRLQTALYLNFKGLAQDVPVDSGFERESEFEFSGISSEWKYKLSDPVANTFGSALYFEASLAPAEIELEGKFILDKRMGNFLFATNLVAAQEWNFEHKDETEKELELELALGLSYFVTPQITVGLELLNQNVIKNGEVEFSALFAGPALSYSHKAGWASLTFMPQLPALHTEDGSTLVLNDRERYMTRLLLGFYL